MLLKSLVAATAALVAGTALAQNQTVDWQTGRATALGNGCPAGSVAFIGAGNDLTVLFSELGVDLPAGGGDANSAVKNCNIVVPAKVARGLYLADLNQTLNYTLQKTSQSEGRISTQSVFFGNTISPIAVYHPYGQYQVPGRDYNQNRTDHFIVDDPAWWGYWCGGARALEGNLITRLRVSGARRSFSETIQLIANEYDVRFQVTAALQFCPVR